MTVLKLFADVLQECCDGKKTGALFVSVAETSENLIRVYFKGGKITNISYGPVKDRDCLDILDCYNLGKAIYFDGMKAPLASADLPPTDAIIATIRKSGKQVQVEGR
jgi:hypothetical protein